MKKTKSPPRIATDKSENLKHSPFASLGGRAAPSGAEQEAEVEREPEREPRPGGRLVLRRETKHRGGKTVVIVSGFEALRDFDPRAIETLAKECKQKLACGGSVDAGQIVLQGDRPAEVAELLRAKGFRVVGVTS